MDGKETRCRLELTSLLFWLPSYTINICKDRSDIKSSFLPVFSLFLSIFILSFLSLSPYLRRTPHPDPLSRLCPAPDQLWVRLYHSAKEQSSPQSLWDCVFVCLRCKQKVNYRFPTMKTTTSSVVCPGEAALAPPVGRQLMRQTDGDKDVQGKKKGLEDERTRAGTGEPQAASCANRPPFHPPPTHANNSLFSPFGEGKTIRYNNWQMAEAGGAFQMKCNVVTVWK